MKGLFASEIKLNYEPRIVPSSRPGIKTSQDAHIQIRRFFDASLIRVREEAVVLFLNRSNKVIGGYKLSTGGITSTVIDISLILGIALKCLAKGIILAHNHPSGELNPSGQDEDITTKLKNAARLMDIALIDHLILNSERYLSFADEGLL
ncbi:MAG: JAB domain-containing protein [Chitinophagaceae bacterium]|nr:JAB domain-containing protein [Chitinophagaceae bacterium]